MRPKESTRHESAATTGRNDNIIVAGDGAEILDESNDEPEYSYHRESTDQGGKQFVRCEECGAELLVELGGKDKLLHKRGCSARDDRQ